MLEYIIGSGENV